MTSEVTTIVVIVTTLTVLVIQAYFKSGGGFA